MNRNLRVLRTCAVILFALALSMATSGKVSAGSDDEFIRREMNIDFEFARNFWTMTSMQGDYYWVFRDMSADLYAVNNECSIDAFMVLERNKKGSVAAYRDSEVNFLKEMKVSHSTGFESWGGRIVAYVISQGKGRDIGMMNSRLSKLGEEPYKNVTYSIVNNGNLLTMVISAPAASWGKASCSKGIDTLIKSFRLFGDPDPRESGIAAYHERTTGSSLPTSAQGTTKPPAPTGPVVSLKSQQCPNVDDLLDSAEELHSLVEEARKANAGTNENIELILERMEDIIGGMLD